MILAVVCATLLKLYGNDAVLDLNGFRAGCVNGTVAYASSSGYDSFACAGNQVVYRFSFALVVFFTLMAIGAAASRVWHVGMWPLKSVLLVTLVVVSFFIHNPFYDGFAHAARVISVVFLLLQVVILFAFAYSIHDAILQRAAAADEANGLDPDASGACTNGYKILYLLLGFGLFAAALVGVGLMFSFYSCGISYALTSVTCILVLLVLALTLGSPNAGGVIPGGVVAAYLSYLCFAALSSHPDAACNPSVKSGGTGAIVLGTAVAALSLAYTSWSAARSVANMFTKQEEPEQEAAGFAQAPTVPSSSDDEEGGMTTVEEAAKQEESEAPVDRRDRVLFHIIMSMGAWYMAMLLTNWAGNAGLTEQSANFEASMESLWVKIASQWVGFLMFGWTVAAPTLLGRWRDFE